MLVIFDKVDVRMGRENHNVDNYIIGTKLKEFRQQAGLSLRDQLSKGPCTGQALRQDLGRCNIYPSSRR